MEMGEKMKFYRKANKLNQKQLSDLSGVSEISIRKYEAGDRFPKSDQLKKIGGNELLEIELDVVSVETVGDVMTLFYLLKEKLGMDFTYTKTPEGSINPISIQIHLKNDKINSCLERVYH